MLFCFISSFTFGQINRQSALADGKIIKIPISETGIYKIDYNYLKDAEGIDIDASNPKNISIYGNGGGMMEGVITSDYNVPEQDLIENPIFISGEGDGKFDSGDFILFYAEGPSKWKYQNGKLTRPTNLYDSKNYYFLKIGVSAGKRIASRSNLDNANVTIDKFDEVIRHESETKNLLADWVQTQGSGRLWYGEQFKNTRERVFDSQFLFENLILEDSIDVNVRMVARAFGSSSRYSVEINNQKFTSPTFSSVNTGSSIVPYCWPRVIHERYKPSSNNISIKIDYPRSSFETEAWLDYIEISGKRKLEMVGNQMRFRNINSIDFQTSQFNLSNANSNIEIWDISEPTAPIQQEFELNGNALSFISETRDQIKEFIAFNKNSGFLTPERPSVVENQNVHGIADAELVIVYHSDFEEAVEKLAEFRREHNGYEVSTVRIDHIVNEFSSGRVDPVGIRNFSKMLHDRNPDKFKWLLLFGDGSYDFRDINGLGKNFIPVYETLESHNPVDAFPADDYFALLTEGEGNDLTGKLDVAIGRIPVETLDEANKMVDKLISYDAQPENLRDWKNRLTLVSDDDDDDSPWTHVTPSEYHYNKIKEKYPDLNVDKIYLDAYTQVATSGGQKYPGVNEAIDQTLFKGVLLINYFGHGGPKGWAQERVLKVENILSWDNSDRLPLFMTATCTFTGYDDPSFKSAGEEVLLNPNGGAFMLLSTTRAVYINGNERLVESIMERIFEKVNGEYLSLGEVFSNGKNSLGTSGLVRNSRKFVLIGDPSMKLALPQYKVSTTFINDHDVLDGVPDTLRALQEVTIEGIVENENGVLMQDFSGAIYPTIYDKPDTIFTLGQDDRSPVRPFELQKNILFKGKATVENGKFKFSFVMPKDINYDLGNGKISYYAENGVELDATGNYQNIIIGGTNPDFANDDEGPVVEVYMNDENFRFGGITNENPVLFVKVSDDNGINVAGNSIGHDLTAVLDGNNQNTLVLNDFYESNLNDYTQGEVRYPLFNLEDGLHKIEVTAWDVANNFGRGFTEFVVASSEQTALQNIINYPNPFIDQTCVSFEHNLTGQDLWARVDIYAMNGSLVKTIIQELNEDSSKECILFNGTSDNGARLAKGVYVYNVKVMDKNGDLSNYLGESEFEKMVILK